MANPTAKPLPPATIGASRKNIEDLLYAFYSTKFRLPPRDQVEFNWRGFEHELEMRIK